MQPGAVSSPAGSPTSTAKFSYASKMVRMPDPFTANGPEAEQTAWPDFELNLQGWLGAADTGFEADLAWIEKNVDVEFDMEVHSDEMATRSKELHSILVGLLRNRSLKILRGVSGRNGYEVYRQLLKLYKPSTKPRAMALLTALMGLPAFGKDRSLHDHVQGLDRLIAEYQKASSLTVPDEVSLSVLIRCLPAHIRQHIQLSLDQSATYASVRSRVLGFETCTSNWAPSRIHSEFGIIGGASSSTSYDAGGPAPMEIGRVETKGKQKGKNKTNRVTKATLVCIVENLDIGNVTAENISMIWKLAKYVKLSAILFRMHRCQQVTLSVRLNSKVLNSQFSLMSRSCSLHSILHMFSSHINLVAVSEGLSLLQTGRMKQLQLCQITLGSTT